MICLHSTYYARAQEDEAGTAVASVERSDAIHAALPIDINMPYFRNNNINEIREAVQHWEDRVYQELLKAAETSKWDTVAYILHIYPQWANLSLEKETPVPTVS